MTLVVRRVLDANTRDPLFPVWRYHPFFTIFRGFANSDGAITAGGIGVRRVSMTRGQRRRLCPAPNFDDEPPF